MMNSFEYIAAGEYKAVKNELIGLINNIQKEVKKDFSFSFIFVGNSERNMITADFYLNIGYDFDMVLTINDKENKYSAKTVYDVLKAAFDKFDTNFKYDLSYDPKRIISIKVKDSKYYKVLHSLDILVIKQVAKESFFINVDESNEYSWESINEKDLALPKKEYFLKNNGFWDELRQTYLNKKNQTDKKIKSRIIFEEVVESMFKLYK